MVFYFFSCQEAVCLCTAIVRWQKLFHLWVCLFDPQSNKGKASPTLFEAWQLIFPSKLASVAGNSKAGLPRGWKYPALFCSINTRPKRCIFSNSSSNYFCQSLSCVWTAWALRELSLREVSSLCSWWRARGSLEGDSEGRMALRQPSPLLPFHCWPKRARGEAHFP